MVKVLKHEDFLKLKKLKEDKLITPTATIEDLLEKYKKNKTDSINIPKTIHEMIKCINERLSSRNVDLNNFRSPVDAVGANSTTPFHEKIIKTVEKHFNRKYPNIIFKMTSYQKGHNNKYLYLFRILPHYSNSYEDED